MRRRGSSGEIVPEGFPPVGKKPCSTRSRGPFSAVLARTEGRPTKPRIPITSANAGVLPSGLPWNEMTSLRRRSSDSLSIPEKGMRRDPGHRCRHPAGNAKVQSRKYRPIGRAVSRVPLQDIRSGLPEQRKHRWSNRRKQIRHRYRNNSAVCPPRSDTPGPSKEEHHEGTGPEGHGAMEGELHAAWLHTRRMRAFTLPRLPSSPRGRWNRSAPAHPCRGKVPAGPPASRPTAPRCVRR